MASGDHHRSGLLTLVRRVAHTGLGALQNRAELFAVEWQEERARLTELLMWAVGTLFFGIMGAMLFTVTIILLFPAELRIYATAGFAVLYLLVTLGAWVSLRSLLKHEPFSESIDQVKEDRAWFESLK